MLCVVRISRSSCTSVSFSEVKERSVDLRHMAAVATQRETTSYVRQAEHQWTTQHPKWEPIG